LKKIKFTLIQLDLLKRLCKKHSLEYDDYTLRLQDTKTDVPLDKTVGETNVSVLCLLKKKQNSGFFFFFFFFQKDIKFKM